MPITFSSFGDIVAVLQLAWQLRAALSEATGASAEIRELILDIDAFTGALQHIKASIEQRRSTIQPAVENGIKHALIACHRVLALILGKVDAFKTRMTSRVGVVAWRHYWAVMAWSILGGKKDVDALRGRLSEQLNVVQTYLALSHSNDHAAVLEIVDRQGTTLDKVYSVMQDIQLRFDVGIPTFQFYDEKKREYYHPFARTSLQKFRKVQRELFGGSYIPYDDDDPEDFVLDPSKSQYVTENSIMLYSVLGESVSIHVLPVQCCYFKERAFDQWQLLIGMRGQRRNEHADAVKAIVERKHAPGAACDCAPGSRCGERNPVELQSAKQWLPLQHTIVRLDIIRALSSHDDGPSGLCDEIYDILRLCPRPKELKRTIIPLLELHVEHQRPSLRTILKLLRAAPLSKGHVWSPLWYQPNIYATPRVQFGWKEPATSKRFNSLQRFLKLTGQGQQE